jgi:serine protease Do
MITNSHTAKRIAVAKFFLLTLFILTGWNLVQAQSSRQLFRRVMPSVVIVQVEKKASIQMVSYAQPAEPTIGSGALISADGKILTSAAVVRNADSITVEFVDGRRLPARVRILSLAADVAVLQLDEVPKEAVVATLGDSTHTQIGDQIFVIGSPSGIANSLSVGWISGRLTEEKDAPERLQLDTALKVGNSGGPVFNLQGEVIGLVSHALTKANKETKAGLAVTSNEVRKLMAEDKRGR